MRWVAGTALCALALATGAPAGAAAARQTAPLAQRLVTTAQLDQVVPVEGGWSGQTGKPSACDKHLCSPTQLGAGCSTIFSATRCFTDTLGSTPEGQYWYNDVVSESIGTFPTLAAARKEWGYFAVSDSKTVGRQVYSSRTARSQAAVWGSAGHFDAMAIEPLGGSWALVFAICDFVSGSEPGPRPHYPGSARPMPVLLATVAFLSRAEADLA